MIVQFLLAIPGTNAPVEHVLSLMTVIGQMKKVDYENTLLKLLWVKVKRKRLVLNFLTDCF